MLDPLYALSPLDGRYAKSVAALRPIHSEYGLMKARVIVELEWLKSLAAAPDIGEVPPFRVRAARREAVWKDGVLVYCGM